MYCDKTNVNELTALMLSHGIEDVVVCPGSRNGVLVHNFVVAGTERPVSGAASGRADKGLFNVCPVTDERSAGFVALGISLAVHRPVAVCVTSGSALLNTLPAVAEAFYRHIPLLVISADRPAKWVGQLDGQTLPQVGALEPYAKTFSADEPAAGDDGWFCNRTINEALLSLAHDGGRPVHINVPVSEPLFSFTTTTLPEVRVVREFCRPENAAFPEELTEMLRTARFPVLLAGQYEPMAPAGLSRIEEKGCLLVLPEILANSPGSWRTCLIENSTGEFAPDVVVQIGGNMVNKRIRRLLRKNRDCRVIRIASDNDFPDTFGHLHSVVRADPGRVLPELAERLPAHPAVMAARAGMESRRACADGFVPGHFSDLGVMQRLSRRLCLREAGALHFGNSSVIRNATYFFDGGVCPIFCNRGVNGIEGTLSAAAGYSLADDGLSLVMIGDLSFFYDQNALWNRKLRGNLRILLFNNGGGQIFRRLPGLSATVARDTYIAAEHSDTAEGIAAAFGLRYLPVRNYEDWDTAVEDWLDRSHERPVLMEVFTRQDDNEEDRILLNTFYQ